MTKARAKYLELLSTVEDAYKFTFRVIDYATYNIVTDEDREQTLPMTYAGKGMAWASPLPYKRIAGISQTIYFQVMVTGFMTLAMLMESYLRVMCLRALPIKPGDDSWFSFQALGLLSNIGENSVTELAQYARIALLMKFVADVKSGDNNTPSPTVTHNDILGMVDSCRYFAGDFEAAFMLANMHVKEEEI